VKRAVLILLLAISVSGSAATPTLIVHERTQRPSGAALSCPGKLSVTLSLSTVTFFDDGEVTQLAWTIPACSDPAPARRWTPPAGTQVRRSKLQPGDKVALQRFLDLAEAKALTDFMNAGPGVGDYEIEIRRALGIQKLSVLSLMPEHDQLRHDPTLLRLICGAKELSGAERPRWCPASPLRPH